MRKILPLLALAVVCVSCDAPFDLSLSRAAAVLPKMTFQGTIGPFSNFGGDEQDMTFSFLPEKRSIAPWIDFRNGFLVMRSPTRTALRHVQYSGGYVASGGWDQTYINPAPRYEPFFFEPLKNNNFVSMVGFDPVNTANSSFQIYQGNPGSLDPMLVPNPKNLHSDYIHILPLNFDGDPLGCSIYPAPGLQPLDDSYWLVRSNIVTVNLREIHLSLDWNNLGASSVLTRPLAPSFPVPELAGVTRCLYYHDPDPVRGPTLNERKSYVSWFDTTAGSWRCIRLWGDAAVSYAVVPNVTHRIDALLTTGRLLSTEDGMGRLYDGDGDGSLVRQFPLGALCLAGERDVDGIPTVIFSLARIVSENYSRTLSLDLYSIPTADLETLGK